MVIVEEYDLLQTFNDHYINLIKRFFEEKSRSYVLDTNLLYDDVTLIVQFF